MCGWWDGVVVGEGGELTVKDECWWVDEAGFIMQKLFDN